MVMTASSDAMVTSCCGNYIILVLGLLVIIECVISVELLELRVPAHVALGSRAQLSCRWALGPADVLYSVKWYKDGREFFRHVPRDSEPRRKFPLPGVDVEKSDASGSLLVLSAATAASAGRYRCEVSGERPLFATVSEHADMQVVVLPEQGPVLTGFLPRYHNKDRVKVTCTSGRCRPACQLSWYINGEPAPPAAVQPPTHQVHSDDLVTTSLLLDFKLTEQHFTNKGVKVKCLATLTTLYWRSNEESALLERGNIREGMLPKVQETNTRADRIHTNKAMLPTCSVRSIVIGCFAIMYTFTNMFYI